MKPTLSLMQTWFNEFNAKVFNNSLPKCPIKFTNTYRQLGQFYWGYGRGIGIKISLYYDRTEEQYRNCLLHEMCHLYCYNNGWKHEHHGPHWKAIADHAYKVTGLYIQRCENITDWEVSEQNKYREKVRQTKVTAPCLLIDLDCGTYHFIVKTSKKVIWDSSDGTKITGCYGYKVRGIYLSDNERFLNWQTSRSLHRGYKFKIAEYERDIKPLLDKAIKVEDLRAVCFHGAYDFLGVR